MIKELVKCKKTTSTDTGWKFTDIPPKHAPIFGKTRPVGRGWKWRSCVVTSEADEFVLFVSINPSKDNWKAWLIKKSSSGAGLVARLEHHGSHPGLHAHADCDAEEFQAGPSSIQAKGRYPKSTSGHRRKNSWTENGFWEASRKSFNISDRKGSLL